MLEGVKTPITTVGRLTDRMIVLTLLRHSLPIITNCIAQFILTTSGYDGLTSDYLMNAQF